jgi:hypothetical protein
LEIGIFSVPSAHFISETIENIGDPWTTTKSFEHH